MTSERSQPALSRPDYFKAFNIQLMNILLQVPLLSVGIEGWLFASRAFADQSKDYLAWQQWRSFLAALVNPHFAYRWFNVLKSPRFIVVATHRQRLYFKPFRVYMSAKWTIKQKVKVIHDTYRFILGRGESFMQVITSSNGIQMANFKLSDASEGKLVLGYDDRYRKEGELVISFVCNELGGVLAAAAFSFEEVNTRQWVCRIGCVQGNKTDFESSSKTAQKLMHGLRPKSLVIFAVQEFARQLEFSELYGAGDSIQAYRRKHVVHLPWIHDIQCDYNAMWDEAGGLPDREGWYDLPLIPVRKDMQEIKSNKRSLYHKRYSLLDELSLKIAETAKTIVE